jgi:hypothetical protein
VKQTEAIYFISSTTQKSLSGGFLLSLYYHRLVLPVVCGLGKFGILAHFLMADLTSFYGIRESTDRLLSSEQNSQINKLPVNGDE